MDLWVGADNVVERQHMPVSQVLDPFGVGAHGTNVATQFRLREHHANLHTNDLLSDHPVVQLKAPMRHSIPGGTGPPDTLGMSPPRLSR
jgi:hypothetical protein